MKSLIRKEWIKMRDDLQVQYFDIHYKMHLKKNDYQRDIYQEALEMVSRKLQHLDTLINPPAQTKLNTYQQLTEIY